MKKTSLVLAFLAVLLLSVSFNQALAQNEIRLEASKDNTLYEDAIGFVSNGKGDFIVGVTRDGEIRRALLAFDIAGTVPAGVRVDSVTLTVRMTRSRAPGTFVNLHRVLADWGEGDSEADAEAGQGITAQPGDATWIHTFSDSLFWQNPGGDFSPDSSARTSIGANPSFYTWESTPEMVADVQDWLDNPEVNFGWILIADEARRTAKRFVSREGADSTHHPVLSVFFSIPVNREREGVPAEVFLAPNYPNPFPSTTMISYVVQVPQPIKLEVYDVLGRKVRTLVDAWHPVGAHRIAFEADGLAGGLYVYRLSTPHYAQHRLMTVLR